MILEKKEDKYDNWISASDWRYSSTIVGLYKYLTYTKSEFEYNEEFLKFHSEDITKEKFLLFVEDYYKEKLEHCQVENLLKKEFFNETEIKQINDLLTSRKHIKSLFASNLFDGKNKDVILDIINKYRLELIESSYINKKNMRDAFLDGSFFVENKTCRLKGYYVDAGKKSKSISYFFDNRTLNTSDSNWFEFIPFAFAGEYEWFFINDNISIENLIRTNQNYTTFLAEDESKSKHVLFEKIQMVSEFLNYDVEVIKKIYAKKDERSYYETLFLKKTSINTFKKLKDNKYLPFRAIDYDNLCKPIKINDEYLNTENIIIEHILSNIYMDDFIEFLLKLEYKNDTYCYRIKDLISINFLIKRKDNAMRDAMKKTYATAKEVAEKIPENKVSGYKAKLINALVSKDYEKFNQTILQLSNYSNVSFGFAYDLFEDFESNIDIAYTFVNSLNKKKVEKENINE